MIRKQIKWLDPITVASITLALSIIPGFIAIKTGNKYYFWLVFILVIIAYIFFNKAKHTPGLILEKQFDGEVKYKPEEGCEPKKLTSIPTGADGINTGKYPGKVYKLRSGTNVYIDKTGEVKAYSPISAWVNPGWVSKKYFDQEELKCWEKLF
ncbi:MAG: hypothetical protein HPY79_04750 [Bacteroidales bacterium]|nr:hypothetical protein [Bacteroidales bacterium]